MKIIFHNKGFMQLPVSGVIVRKIVLMFLMLLAFKSGLTSLTS